MTTVTTLLCPVMTPALTKLLAGQQLEIPFWNMFFEIIFMVIVPLGRVLRSVICPAVSRTRLSGDLGHVYYLRLHAGHRLQPPAMLEATGAVVLVVLLLNLGGMAAGYGVARCFACRRPTPHALIEVGMQNAGLGTVLAIHNLGPGPPSPPPSSSLPASSPPPSSPPLEKQKEKRRIKEQPRNRLRNFADSYYWILLNIIFHTYTFGSDWSFFILILLLLNTSLSFWVSRSIASSASD